MRSLLRSLFCSLAVLLSLPGFAQLLPPFGSSFPAANTRYGAMNGQPVLRSNGRDAFLFWGDKTLLVTKVLPGEQHLGRPVVETAVFSFDAVFAGDQFVVAATIDDPTFGTRIEGRVVDRNGSALGESFPIIYGGSEPRLAYNGKVVLMVYRRGSAVEAVTLDKNGRPITLPEKIGDSSAASPRVAANNSTFLATVATSNGVDLVRFDGNGKATSASALSVKSAQAPIGSNGDRFLVAATSTSNIVTAYLLDANGGQIRAIAIGEPGSTGSEVIWNGTAWAILWSVSSSLKLSTIDSQAVSVASSITVPSTSIQGTITLANNRTYAAWKGLSSIHASPLPFPTPVEMQSFSASSQQLMATAASADATLAVWREVLDGRISIRAGVRKRDGSWREREIAPSGFNIVAASNGQAFVVINSDTATFLSVDAIPFRTVTNLPFVPTAIAWNGTNYLLLGTQQTAILTPNGMVSPPNVIAPSRSVYSCNSMASNGSEFFATCLIAPQVTFTGAPAAGVAGLRFDATGLLLETLTIANNTAFFALGDVVWNGSRYFTAWREGSFQIVAARITGSTVQLQTLSNEGRGYVSVAPAGSGAFIGFSDTNLRTTVAFVRDEGQVPIHAVIDRETSTPELSKLHSFVDGTIVRMFSLPAAGAPHYGQPHVMMQIGTFALPQKPDTPVLTVKREGSVARLQWTAPPQTVTSYRVEYSINDGVWVALEEGFTPNQLTYLFALPWNDVTYSFRVRAINDAGPSGYSFPISLTPSKRRSAR
ncbi:MAG TPA: fibronectin type III domain-containing protein [Thermoanaerobaculia bacterium]|nr:fibronectin type III domain-containing protein [Thermoanaerobaculia bacterium]